MTSDLDLPLLPSAEQIRRREFATVRRGYDPDQVRDYLRQVAEQLESLEGELREASLAAESKAASPSSTLPAVPDAQGAPTAPVTEEDAYQRIAERFATMIESADREAAAVVAEAKTEADRLLEEARTEADRVRVDAQAHAEEARQEGEEELAKAKVEADRVLGSLATRRDALMSQMHDMQSKLLTVAQALEVSMTTEDDEGEPSDQGDAGPKEAVKAEFDEDLVDPRYEDLWVSSDQGEAVELPDLASIELDFDEDASDAD